MYTIYSQRWDNGKISYHRSPEDILEFAKNQTPVPTRDGPHKVNLNADYTAHKRVKDNLGAWN